MPIYDYACKTCGEPFSFVMSLREKETTKIQCPKCKSTDVKPVYSGFFVVTSKKS